MIKEGCHVTCKRDTHTEIWFPIFVWSYHFVDQHGTETLTKQGLERILTVLMDFSREDVAVVFFTEANILSMLASDLYSEKLPDWNIWRHL